MTGGEVAASIGRWRPSSVSPQAAAFARDVIGAVAPTGRERAKNLLWAAAKLADYAIGIGLDAELEVVLHPSVIERFTAHAPGLSGPARRTLRTNLRFIGRAVAPQLHPTDAPLPRERTKTPYSPAEIAGYLALADAQPTLARRISIMPFATQMSGWVYLAGAVLLNGQFMLYAVRLYLGYSDALARRTFVFSIQYLAMLFGVMLVDHYVGIFLLS